MNVDRAKAFVLDNARPRITIDKLLFFTRH